MVTDSLLEDKDVQLWIKREDLIHPIVSGNKYRKLDFLIPLLKGKSYNGILSFGGVYSNHIHALAWMCREYNIPLTVLVRSYDPDPHSPTLDDIKSWGAVIRIISPSQYREKETPDQVNHWKLEYPGYLIIPEGGSHIQALEGVGDMMREIEMTIPDADVFICPVGTGATMAGMVLNKKQQQRVIGVSALKSSVIYKEVADKWKLNSYMNWGIADQWHFGGYGRFSPRLMNYLDWFEGEHGILLDPIYNGKAMYAFYEYLRFDLIPPGSKVVFIHTGGLQGWRGIKSG